MSDTDTTTRGGFTGDPADALTVAGTGGCCGNPPQATLDRPEPAPGPGVCCGTGAEAPAEQSCCGSAARSTAVATGPGCCG